MTRTIMNEKGLSLTFWAEATYTTIYLLNWYPTKTVENKTPFEVWSCGRKSLVNHLKVFASICYVHVPKEMRHKLKDKCEKYVFVGYSTKSKGYRIFSLKRNKVIESRDVIFNEKDNWDWKNKNVESMSVQIGDNAQEESCCGSYENDKKKSNHILQ
jgi:hypothetical protein